MSDSLANLMVQRNIRTPEEANAFFNWSDYLHDPFLMKDMNIAVERLSTAIKKNEKILVYGDYDVDGITAVALVYSFLKEQYSNVEYYIPDRYRKDMAYHLRDSILLLRITAGWSLLWIAG